MSLTSAHDFRALILIPRPAEHIFEAQTIGVALEHIATEIFGANKKEACDKWIRPYIIEGYYQPPPEIAGSHHPGGPAANGGAGGCQSPIHAMFKAISSKNKDGDEFVFLESVLNGLKGIVRLLSPLIAHALVKTPGHADKK
jgi:hypothetical protein